MKLFVAVAALATIAVVYTHPGSERVKRQSSSSSSSAGASGGNGFAFSGGLPFGDLFSTFPGFDQGGRGNGNGTSNSTSSKRDTVNNDIHDGSITGLHPPAADASVPGASYGHPPHPAPAYGHPPHPAPAYGHPAPVHPFIKPVTPLVPPPGLLRIFAQTIQMLGQLITGIIHAAISNVGLAKTTFSSTLNHQLAHIGSSHPAHHSAGYGSASTNIDVEQRFNQSDLPTGLSPPEGALPSPGSFEEGFVPGPAPPGTSGFVPAASNTNDVNVSLANVVNDTIGRLSASIGALLNSVEGSAASKSTK